MYMNMKSMTIEIAMKKIIAQCKQTPQGFCCLETDYLGMYRFLKREVENPKWTEAFGKILEEISFVKEEVETEYPHFKAA